jgi:peptide/nickel transport system substrate-binding protein
MARERFDSFGPDKAQRTPGLLQRRLARMPALAGTARRRRLSIATVFVLAAATLAACAPGDDSPSGDDKGGETTLTADWAYLGTMDWSPAGSASDNEKVLSLVSGALVGIDHDSRDLVGELAESFDLSPDGKTWTFKLRPDVPFEDGYGTVTSDDVKYNWGEYISKESEHGAADQLAQAVDGNMDNFEIVSDLEFKLHTEHPITTLPAVLCSCANGMAILSKKYADEHTAAEVKNLPVGTGPWQMVSSKVGVNVVMKAFPDYWGDPKPAFDNLVLNEVPDSAARLVQVQSGEADMAELSPSLVTEAKASNLEVLTVPDVGNAFVILGGSYWDADCCKLDADAPWIQADDPAKGQLIREAMSEAIDRELILDKIMKGNGKLVYGPLLEYDANPLLHEDGWDPPQFDLADAKKKLAEGGYPNGFPVKVFIYDIGETDVAGISEAIAGMWEDLGLQVQRQTADEDILDAKTDAAETDGLAWVKMAGFSAEPALELGRYLESRGDDFKFLYPAMEQGYTDMVNEPDRTKRFAYARQVIQALAEKTIVIPLFTVDMAFVAGPRVGSWDPTPGLNAFSGFETVTPAS